MRARPGAKRRSQRGGIMVQALIVLAGLVALMATLAANEKVALDATQNALRSRRAEAAARSAVARALAAVASANANVVTAADDWAELGGTNGGRAFDLGDGTATFRVQVIDAEARVNVNAAPQAHLQRLPITPEQTDSLLDWREASTNPRPNGAKDDYYNGLDTPYNARLGSLTTVGELLLVKGWTYQGLLTTQAPEGLQPDAVTNLTDANGDPEPLINLLTAESGAPNTQANGSTRVGLGAGRLNAQVFAQFGVIGQTAQQLANRGPYASFQQLLSQPGVNASVAQRLLDAATFTADPRLPGKINLNTASEAVLQTVPGVTPDVAAAIAQRQSGAGGFQTLGALATVPNVTPALLAQFADYFTVGSDTWLVRAYGESGGVGVAVEAVVRLRNGQARVITWERLPDPGVPSWWRWEAETTETIDAGEQTGSGGGTTSNGTGGAAANAAGGVQQ